MSEHQVIQQSYTRSRIKVYPGSTLILRLSLHSQIAETLLLRPTLDDWIVDDGKTICLPNRLEPAYHYLYQGSQVNQKITISIPFLLQPGQILKSWLRFPGIQEEAVAIELEVLSPKGEKDKDTVVEVPLAITLPLAYLGENSLSNVPDRSTTGIFGLLSGVMDLDKVPSRWLLAELLVNLCQKGESYAQTEPGRQLLDRLKSTRFFQNGINAFAYAQIPNWLADSLKGEKTILGGQTLLYVWERWLLGLVATDESQKASPPPLLPETFVSKLGGSADRYFAGIVLGLAQISPSIATKLKDIASREASVPNTKDSDRATEATKSLVIKLAGLDTLPARWLVVELLILLCQQGEKYAQTKAGSKLLTQLKHTSFFENGVLAFTAAQVPRWLAITQEAASASHNFANTQMGQNGLLYVGEEWLWSLQPTDFNLGQPDRESPVSDAAANAFVASLGMDAERWFSCVVLGLALLSPRIAAIWDAIATSRSETSVLAATRSRKPIFNDVLEEGGSLQR